MADVRAAQDGQDLMRLGWMLAETLGRYRLGDDVRLAPEVAVDRRGVVLPLGVERSAAEQRIEAERVLTAVATAQRFDVPAVSLGVPREQLGKDDDSVTVHMVSLATKLNAARHADDAAGAAALLSALKDLFYKWDGAIQDALAAGPYGRSSAYQLGRGLAETYWALDKSAEAGAYESWEHLLVQRFNTLATLLRRCAGMLPTLAAETLTATLQQWRGVAESIADKHSKRPLRAAILRHSHVDPEEALCVLRQQTSVWRDLLLSSTKPASVLATDQTWLRARSLGPLFKSFALEISALLGGLLLVGGSVAFVAAGGPGVPKVLGGTLAAVLGAFGITSSTVLARAKAVGQGLMTQLQEKITADGVVANATYLPDSYARHKTSVRQAASARSARHLGPVVSYDHASVLSSAASRRRAKSQPQLQS